MTARQVYRSTFAEYGRRLEALEGLMISGSKEQIEIARAAMEEARVAHSRARDLLARELTPTNQTAPAIPKTAAAACGSSLNT